MLRLLTLLLLLSGCYADELERETQQEPFFDLAGYIDGQVDSLTAGRSAVEKTIVLNGNSETQTLSDLNFGNDLKVFRNADINKPAYLDKYRTDRRQAGDTLIQTYTATDSTLETRLLTVRSLADRPVRIDIVRRTGTVLSAGIHHLRYDPASGYRLRTEQQNTFGTDLDATITVSWQKK
ncbi:hypothetical protein GGR28_002485 [Lewinella aquimaris]|uniref:Uncharacterized protein n=1 Tax=Neolewinella aquimaris TaxID=1835722 RepID=A0A840ED02_9BACT|nr:hypothetical protein [Neolewinella aquimaris]MBB4079858.1 hypothetical protein [Neolewinella aquimaris]